MISPYPEKIVPHLKSSVQVSPHLRLAPGHPIAAYSQIYARTKRIHIPDLFLPSDAAWLHAVLAGAVPWNTVLNSESAVYDLTPETIQSLPPGKWTQLQSAVLASASGNFHYMFENCRLSEAGEAYRDPTHPLSAVVAFLNAPETLSMFRSVTGHSAIARVDAQATRYGRGHFLHPHDDLDQGKGRLAAYVLNMTAHWRPEWGGVLNFLDQDGHIAEGYAPRFNALNIFDVGVSHYVSYVAPYALNPRLSITGWLRAA